MVVFHREILCWMIKRVCLSRKGLGYLHLHVIGRIKYIYRSIPYGEPTNPHSNPILASAGNRPSQIWGGICEGRDVMKQG